MEDVRSKLAQPLSAMELVWEVLKLEDSAQRRVITLLYLWWTKRCRVREGETQRRQEQLAQLVRCYVEEWASLKLTSTEPIPNRKKPGWTKPSLDIVKINCDGAFTMEQLTGGSGYVMRGCDGAIICTGYGKLDKVLEASHAEIVACLQALQRATEMGIQNVVLETDAMTVVEAIKAQVPDRSSASGLLWELKESLLCNFRAGLVTKILAK
jgi:hypothetical protein